MVGGLWNCLFAVKKAYFILALASLYTLDFLARTETWILPQNSLTPTAPLLIRPSLTLHKRLVRAVVQFCGCLKDCDVSESHLSPSSSQNMILWIPYNYSFLYDKSTIPKVIYHPPGTSRKGQVLKEMDTFLSFLLTVFPLTVLGDTNLQSNKLQYSCLFPLLYSLLQTFISNPPTHKRGHALDLVFSWLFPRTDINATPLHLFFWQSFLIGILKKSARS